MNSIFESFDNSVLSNCSTITGLCVLNIHVLLLESIITARMTEYDAVGYKVSYTQKCIDISPLIMGQSH